MNVVFFLGVCIVAALYICFSNSRFAVRARALFNKQKATVEDKMGTIADDRRAKIDNSKRSLGDLRQEFAKVSAKEKVLAKELEVKKSEAEKHGQLARKAAESNNKEAAKSYLKIKSRHEKRVADILDMLEEYAAILLELQILISQCSTNIEDAEYNQELFEGRVDVALVKQELLDSVDAFGGAGKFDFSESEKELMELESLVEAKQEASMIGRSDKSIVDFEKQLEDDKLEAEYSKLVSPVEETKVYSDPTPSYDYHSDSGSSSYDSGGCDSGSCD